MCSKQWMWRIIIPVLAIVLGAVSAHAQQASVRIVSPAAGTVVRPGQTVMVSVVADISLENLALIGERPLGVGQVVSESSPGLVTRGQGEATPIQFKLSVPSDIRAGIYSVTVIGTVASREIVSDSLTLDVEWAEDPVKVWTEPSSMIQFYHIGDRIPIRVLGRFADGSQRELSRSTKTSFTSDDPDVATVSAGGFVTAVGPGKTSIEVHTPSENLLVPVRMNDMTSR